MNRVSAVEAVLLSAWLGAAILVAAVVAPAAFKVLPTRTLAGALVGQVLPVIFIAGLVIAALAGAIEARSSGNNRWIATTPIIVMAIACVLAQFAIGSKIVTIRAAMNAPVDPPAP